MSNKKIILTVTNDLQYDQRMQRICHSLSRNGFDVLLVGRMLKNSNALTSTDFKQRRLKCVINQGPLFYLEFNVRLFLLLMRADVQIICNADLDTLLSGWMTRIFKKLFLIYDAHEYFPESPELEGRELKKWIWYKLEAFLVPRVDAAYTVSPSIQRVFETNYKKNFSLIRNLPQLSKPEFTNPVENSPKYMIYQGALNAGRGLEQIIECMPQLDLDLWLAGEGDLSSELRGLADKKAAGRVVFLGRVPPDQLRKITASAVMGINLLQPMGESYKMSLSNKFFDYIMAEIPQICIDFQEYRKINENSEVAVLIADLQYDNLVKAINGLAGDAHLREKLKSNCRRARQEYNWEKEEIKLLEIYHRIEG